MFIRQVKKQRSKSSKTYYQYTLVQTSRVNGKVKQFSILYLGSDKLLYDIGNRNLVLAILKSKIFKQAKLFPISAPQVIVDLAMSYYQKYLNKYPEGMEAPTSVPPDTQTAEFHNVDIKGLEVTDSRSFGAEILCKQVADKLQLRKCFKSAGLTDNQVIQALIAVISRAIFVASEHKTAQYLKDNSSLLECLRYYKTISHKQLYAISDKLFEHQDPIDQFLNNRIDDLFNLQDKLVIFDISNTYFETAKRGSTLADYGKSKEKRSDCPIVVFTGVVNEQGFIRHSRIYHGKTADSTTLEDMLKDLEKHSSNAKQKTIVIDAGIAVEDNLTLLRKRGYKYVCVSRIRLNDYPGDELQNAVTLTNNTKNYKIELKIFKPKDAVDTWMYVQSDNKRKKEQSMDDKLSQRFEQDLQTIANGINKKGGIKKYGKVWERIGRAKQKNKSVSGKYNIEVEQENGIATQITWSKKETKKQQDKTKGIYFLRTNLDKPTENVFWNIYNTIREVEATFRCLKTDLNIRPVYHQLDHRIKSHIYLAILAYQLVNTIRYMLKQKEINMDWSNILRVLSNHRIQNIILPTDKKNIHIRIPTTPDDDIKEIFESTDCDPSQKPVKKYVVYH